MNEKNNNENISMAQSNVTVKLSTTTVISRLLNIATYQSFNCWTEFKETTTLTCKIQICWSFVQPT